ncbi:MAG: uroporphyrinogen-III synthase, partial [Magnetococcales bacterium]|nr:uroporphyrinogen-III synthase [Magnetococcales bacterium]
MRSPNLAGRTILITRPQPEAEQTADLVRRAGGHPLVAPALVMGPPADPVPFHAAMARLDTYAGIILTSAHGARALLDALPAGSAHPPLYAVGAKTAALLHQGGCPATIPTQPGDAQALAQFILSRHGPGTLFLFLRAESGQETLVHILEAGGCRVELVVAYRAMPITQLPEPVLTALHRREVSAISF